MLLNVDGSAIEWVCASYLSGDKVAHEEIWNKVDQHTANQVRFGLPSRLIAKTFVFRLIYGGSAYSYANDPDFTAVSTSEKFWQQVIDEFYAKYQGIAAWHINLVREASSTGRIVMPTGRFYPFEPSKKGYKSEWPRTKILNYPVQGLAADIVCLARVVAFKEFKQQQIRGKLISTIHDSIVADIEPDELERASKIFVEAFTSIPENFEKMFGVKFTLPVRCEISYGPDKFNLTKME